MVRRTGSSVRLRTCHHLGEAKVSRRRSFAAAGPGKRRGGRLARRGGGMSCYYTTDYIISKTKEWKIKGTHRSSCPRSKLRNVRPPQLASRTHAVSSRANAGPCAERTVER